MVVTKQVLAFINEERQKAPVFQKVKCRTTTCDRWVNYRISGGKGRRKEYCDLCTKKRRKIQKRTSDWIHQDLDRPEFKPCRGCGAPVKQRQYGRGAQRKRCAVCQVARRRVLAQQRRMRLYGPGGKRYGFHDGLLDHLSDVTRDRIRRTNKKIESAHQMHRAGLMLEEIARGLGCSIPEAQSYLNQNPTPENLQEDLTPGQDLVF